MKYFLDENQTLRAIEEDGCQDFLIKNVWVSITNLEADLIRNPPKTLIESRAIKLLLVQNNYENAVKAMTGNTDPAEMASWTKQEQEARAWIADNTAITPIIDNLIIGRAMGESKADLVAKIIAKADAYAVAYSLVLGAYHAKQKAITVATTVAEVEAI